MKIIVTGGAGFIGSHLVNKLIKQNHEVLIIDKISHASNTNRLPSAVEIKKFDLSNIRTRYLMYLIKDFNPDVIYHLAAQSHVDNSIRSPVATIRNNVLATTNLVESTVTSGVNPLLINVSTDEVFGSLNCCDAPCSEQSNLKPNSPYSASKASSDMIVRSYGQTFGMMYIITRCTNNYGPGQHIEKFIPKIIYNAFHGKDVPIYGDGENIRSWIHVSDHTDALIKLISPDSVLKYREYNISNSGLELSNNQVAKSVLTIMDKIIPRMRGSYLELIKHVPDRKGHDMKYSLDSALFQREFKWSNKMLWGEEMPKIINSYIEEFTMKGIVK